MRYVVILDSRTTIGAHYLAGNNDGILANGDLKHPALDCSEITTDSPRYMFLKREIRRGGGTQTLYVPHECVAFVVCYADEGPKPVGFLASSPT